MISLSLTVIVLGAVLSGHLFGLRMFKAGGTRLEASRDNNRCFSLLTTDVRAAKMIAVGQGTKASFTEVGANTAQLGSALQLYPSSNTNVYVRYYLDDADQSLKRLETNGTLAIITALVANSNIFALQEINGQVISNKQNHPVVSVRLNFSSLKGSGDSVGSGNHYATYGVQTKIATRSLE